MKQFVLRLDDDLAARVDEARGKIPRERWIRETIAHALWHQGYDGTPSKAAEEPVSTFDRLGLVRASSLAKSGVRPVPKKG